MRSPFACTTAGGVRATFGAGGSGYVGTGAGVWAASARSVATLNRSRIIVPGLDWMGYEPPRDGLRTMASHASREPCQPHAIC